MWSNNTKTNNIITILLFLFAVGFMNKASLIIVLIALLLMLKDNMLLRFKDAFCFGVLAVFAVSYFIFAAQIDFSEGLRAIGCPVAFYIGSNMKGNNVENAKKCILVIAFGMAIHIMLNVIYEIIRFGGMMSSESVHYDIWSGMYTATTGAMTNGTMLVGCISYLLFYESRKGIRFLGIVLLIVTIIYGVMVGSRTIFIMFLISLFTGAFVILTRAGSFTNALKQGLRVLIILTCVCVISILIYLVFREKIIGFVENSYLMHRIQYAINNSSSIFSTERWSIRKGYYSQLMRYMWGGRELYDSIGNYAHELWLDIWDVGGMIPAILMLIYTMRSVLRTMKIVVARETMLGDKVLLSCCIVCFVAQFLVEPVLSGAPILIYSYCIVDGALVKHIT